MQKKRVLSCCELNFIKSQIASNGFDSQGGFYNNRTLFGSFREKNCEGSFLAVLRRRLPFEVQIIRQKLSV